MSLTKKQEIFCKEYVKLDDKAKAYRIAYSAKKMLDTTIYVKACELSKIGKVSVRIKELQSIAADVAKKEFQIDSKVLLKHLNILRGARIDHFVDFVVVDAVIGLDEKGEEIRKKETVLQFKPFEQLSEEKLMCIESIKNTRNGIELKLHGVDWTIEKIARHIGFYEKDNTQKSPTIKYENVSKQFPEDD